MWYPFSAGINPQLAKVDSMGKRTGKSAAAASKTEMVQVGPSAFINIVKENPVSDITVTESARATVPATTVYNLTQEQIDAAIEAGDIVQGGIVDVTIKAGAAGNAKDEAQPYEQLLGVTFDGMVLLSGGKQEPQTPRGDDKVDGRTDEQKAKGAPDHFNYGLDLEVKRTLRKQLETEISGPSKIIERTAKLLFEQKMFPSMDAARAHVKSMRAEAGLDS